MNHFKKEIAILSLSLHLTFFYGNCTITYGQEIAHLGYVTPHFALRKKVHLVRIQVVLERKKEAKCLAFHRKSTLR